MGIWGALGGDKDVLEASTITHSIAAPFYFVSVFLAGSLYIIANQTFDKGIIVTTCCTLPLFILSVVSAVVSCDLYNSAITLDSNTTTTSPFNL